MAFVPIYHVRYFLQKMKITFEVSAFAGSLFSRGSLLSGFANTWDILSLVLEVGLPELESATFEGSLLS